MHPVGPQSPVVYWLRRGLVLVAAVAVVAGLVWFVTGRGKSAAVDPTSQNQTVTGSSQMTGVLATGGTASGEPAVPQSALQSADGGAGALSSGGVPTAAIPTAGASTTTPATGASGTAGSTAASKTTTAPVATAISTAASTQKSTPAPPKATTSAKPTPTTSSAKPTPTTTAPPPPVRDAQGRLICPAASLAIRATTGAPAYPVGARPILGMTVTNTGSVPCVRDLSGRLQVYTVFTAAGARVWSTADCFPGEGTDMRQLAAGATATYNIKWSGTTSSPGCTAARTRVPAGSYKLVAALGALQSPPQPFTITG